MDSLSPPSWFDKLIAPRVLFLGVAVSFLGCCLAGFLVSRENHFESFDRFHQLISRESLYYPTVCQVRELARSRLDPNKITVIVGGTSILHGTSQPLGQVWTERLQALLGDQYQVLNLALRCGRTTEIGAVMAEVLRSEYKSLLITDVAPGGMHPDPDGLLYKYFFWDAYYKGLLVPDKVREDRLEQLIPEAETIERTLGKEMARQMGGPAEAQRELRTGMCLDQALYFYELWNTLAYRWFHTVWTPQTYGRFSKARSHFRDNDPGPRPLASRYAYDPQGELGRVHALLPGKCVKDATGHWVEDGSSGLWPALDRAATTSFPAPTRPRTLMLVMWNSPYYLAQFTADEQACHAAVSRRTVRHLEKLGFAALEVGNGYTPADYADRVHLTGSGGVKLAQSVAPVVRALTERLGYLDGGKKR
jgi:hypothetical protein